MNPFFVGISSSTSYHEKFHDRLKNIVQYEMPVAVVLKKIISLMTKIECESNNFCLCRIPYEDVFK